MEFEKRYTPAINDMLSRKKTLIRGSSSFMELDSTTMHSAYFHSQTPVNPSKKKTVIFLGLGINPQEDAVLLCPNAHHIYYIECPLFEKACHDAHIERNIPHSFIPIDFHMLSELILESAAEDTYTLFFYRQNIDLFPSFWGELLMHIQELSFKTPTHQQITPKIFIAGSSHDLLFQELCDAVKHTNHTCLTAQNISTKQNHADYFGDLAHYLRRERPQFFISVNARDIDSKGHIYFLLKKLNIKLALWIADNPWNILSNFKNDWWKNVPLFITDHSFINSLEAHGAKNVHHLPLASSPFFRKTPQKSQHESILFVGHSAFKHKENFFAATSYAPHFSDNGIKRIHQYIETYNNKSLSVSLGNASNDSLPNFHYFYEQFNQEKPFSLWHDNHFRKVSLASIDMDSYWRNLWLNALEQSIYIIGDDGWKQHINANIPIHPPVDYYAELPTYYAKHKYTLNITSMLMPANLSQRHFDVWTAGGFLLSSPSAGMKIFPQELANAITVHSPEQTQKAHDTYSSNHKLYKEIQEEFSHVLTMEHQYIHRIQTVLAHC